MLILLATVWNPQRYSNQRRSEGPDLLKQTVWGVPLVRRTRVHQLSRVCSSDPRCFRIFDLLDDHVDQANLLWALADTKIILIIGHHCWLDASLCICRLWAHSSRRGQKSLGRNQGQNIPHTGQNRCDGSRRLLTSDLLTRLSCRIVSKQK